MKTLKITLYVSICALIFAACGRKSSDKKTNDETKLEASVLTGIWVDQDSLADFRETPTGCKAFALETDPDDDEKTIAKANVFRIEMYGALLQPEHLQAKMQKVGTLPENGEIVVNASYKQKQEFEIRELGGTLESFKQTLSKESDTQLKVSIETKVVDHARKTTTFIAESIDETEFKKFKEAAQKCTEAKPES